MPLQAASSSALSMQYLPAGAELVVDVTDTLGGTTRLAGGDVPVRVRRDLDAEYDPVDFVDAKLSAIVKDQSAAENAMGVSSVEDTDMSLREFIVSPSRALPPPRC